MGIQELGNETHGAILSAHGTGGGFCPPLFPDLLEFMRVDDQGFLPLPVQTLAGLRERQVPLKRARHAFDDIGGVPGDPGGDQSFPDVRWGGKP